MDCPYRGLLPFREQDAKFFYGRDRFLFGDQSSLGLVRVVQVQPLVAVIGPSGSGKSSVIFAGLIPHLRATENWIIDSFRPQNQPFYGLASALVRLLKPELDEIQQPQRSAELMIDLMQGKLNLSQLASNILERNSEKRILLVIDQFEEIYTLCSGAEQIQFIDFLLNALNVDNLRLVLTIRADFYGYILSHPPFQEALQKFTPQLISSMNREELQSSIEKPLEKWNVSLEAKLVERILDDVGNEPGNLPLLEFALTQMWMRKQNNKLTHYIYDEIGGVKKALANHAEEVYIQLNDTQKKQAQHIFVQLVYPGQGTEDTRRLATHTEIKDENWGLVTHLSSNKARLLVTGWHERIHENTVEVVHEALIREWKRLQKWIADDRKFRTWQESLRFLIQNWKTNKQDGSALLRGVLLVEAEAWLKQRSDDISPVEKKFIRESRWRENLNKYGFATFGIIITSLLVFLSLEHRNQEQIFAVFTGSYTNSDSVYILPRLLRMADQQARNNNVDGALLYYRTTLRAIQNFRSSIEDYPERFQSHDAERIEETWNTAETSSLEIIKKFRLPALEEELRNGSFGQLIDGAQLTDYENQYTEGALRTTYEIIMQNHGVGADLNGDSLISSLEESELIPCDLLKEIEDLWRRYTKENQCGWYGSADYTLEPSCEELNGQTLTNQIFPPPQTIVIDRISSCSIVRETTTND